MLVLLFEGRWECDREGHSFGLTPRGKLSYLYSTTLAPVHAGVRVLASTPSTIDSDAAERRARRIWRAVMLVLVVYWLTLITAMHIPRVPEPLSFRASDKVVHLLAYAVLGALVGLAWSLRWRFGWLAALGLWVLLAAHGALDEVTQPIFGRHADVLDWYADMLGAALGLAVMAGARVCWLRMRPTR